MTPRKRVFRRHADRPDLGPAPEGLSLDGEQHSCGGSFRQREEPTEVFIRGRTVLVPQAFYACDKCGEKLFDLWQMDDARAAAARKLNEEEGLLQPEEIKALRESLGLTQAQFEQALGIGEKTVVRWEQGKVLPGQATALLLLLIRRDPTALEFLALRRGVDLSLPRRLPFKLWTADWEIEALGQGSAPATPTAVNHRLALVA